MHAAREKEKPVTFAKSKLKQGTLLMIYKQLLLPEGLPVTGDIFAGNYFLQLYETG
jgi:hypothetical protein